ncbi:DUF4142 domain-containing protein [Caballeronia sp. Lep1P3]|uniref:DUF4142 domain-containing protein n=1 Tax=Caballeronia sp. Lep1P3 TaxID=2878150 RepID=UPI001FD4CBFC|nr:DUF4142 domain-containing protein [Caballeronia sp. Lep1P3]
MSIAYRSSICALLLGVAGIVNIAQAATDDSAARFLGDAIQDGRAEIESCELALKSTHDPAVKAFAQRMIADHKALDARIAALAQKKGYRLPDGTTLVQRTTYAALKPLSGHAFDTVFMKHNVSDHEADVKHFSDQADHASDPDVRALAADGLATLREHLQLAKDTDAKLHK